MIGARALGFDWLDATKLATFAFTRLTTTTAATTAAAEVAVVGAAAAAYT